MTVAIALLLALSFAGCDSSGPDASAATPKPAKATAGRKSSPSGDADMVAAFSHGEGGIVDLKFKLTRRPAVGEPVDIELALIPNKDLERLFARFQVSDGLQLLSGAETERFEHPAKGEPLAHKLTVTAQSDGIFYVTAVLLADSETESIARTFYFPLIAGKGLPELPSAAAPTSVADSKEPAAHP